MLMTLNDLKGFIQRAEVEPVILTDPYYSFLYAKDIIQGRWIEAEEILSQYPEVNDLYLHLVLKNG